MTEAKLDKTRWAEAAVTTNYQTRRVPQRRKAKTPDEALHGRKPDVSHVAVLCCKELSSIQKNVRNNMEPRARKGVFLEYRRAIMGYGVPFGKEVMKRRDVRFDESLVSSTATDAGNANAHPWFNAAGNNSDDQFNLHLARGSPSKRHQHPCVRPRARKSTSRTRWKRRSASSAESSRKCSRRTSRRQSSKLESTRKRATTQGK